MDGTRKAIRRLHHSQSEPTAFARGRRKPRDPSAMPEQSGAVRLAMRASLCRLVPPIPNGEIDMAAFYELRQYKIRPGKMAAWLELMEREIIPFQVAKGAVITGSFRGETDDSVYFWIRRFESEEDRVRIYKDIYESDHWKNTISPQVGELIDRSAINVQRVVPTRMSAAQ
jgi:hypothetical protein